MRTLPRHGAPSFLLRLSLLALTAASLCSARLHAQAAKAAAPSDTASGFSIETEMLTYRALEGNGEAIACDVAAYLYGTKTDFKSLPTGAICNVGSTSGPSTIGVVILPFDRSVFADFQIWRSDMQTMAEFETRGASACTAPPAESATAPPGRPQGRGLTAAAPAAAAVGGVMGALTPAGAMISTASGVLGLFASDHSASPVGGTIQDQAFMDNVSRELRAVNVSVLMPSIYAPYGLTSVDPARSPFLISLDKLLHTHDCLVASKSKDDPDAKNIEAFLAVLSGPTSSAKPAAQSGASGGASSPAAAQPGAKTAAQPSAEPAAPTISHLEAVLSADGLAQRLGADPATGKIPEASPHHLLLLKALESGGSVNRSSSIFGTRMSYSGGSVGTYALFELNGELECSGNVYDYAGPVGSKKFQKQLRGYTPNPAAQVIFQRGTCRQH
jgi:hypothetical protein